uniref:Tail completion protein n=1 Tax=Siphoviridae sp. ctOb14 TaxID=2827862 RepID=A0A8S5SMX0_9CAUD|nr:MAG TPA: tail completion protein [Siphoviridae sp. ctOb14]
MITLVNIKKAINEVLKTNFPDAKLYAREIEEGFIRPSFFTQLIPATSEYETRNFTSNKLTVIINYFSKDETDLANVKMYDSLRQAFGMNLQIQGRHLIPRDIRADETDGVLQYEFDLDYLDDVPEEEEHYEIMKELYVTTQKE